MEHISYKRIRHAGSIRYAAYDKVAKVKVIIDDMETERGKSEWHIAWDIKIPGQRFYPQTDIKGGDLQDALHFAFDVARRGEVKKYAIGKIN